MHDEGASPPSSSHSCHFFSGLRRAGRPAVVRPVSVHSKRLSPLKRACSSRLEPSASDGAQAGEHKRVQTRWRAEVGESTGRTTAGLPARRESGVNAAAGSAAWSRHFVNDHQRASPRRPTSSYKRLKPGGRNAVETAWGGRAGRGTGATGAGLPALRESLVNEAEHSATRIVVCRPFRVDRTRISGPGDSGTDRAKLDRAFRG